MNRLKGAEKDASKIVSEARQYRVDKMRDAKTGAEEAIKAYEKDLQSEYASGAATREKDEGAGNLDASTDSEIQTLGRDFSANKEAVEKMLVDLVCKTSN
jgi:V-type H+-transporting ATPase subunit G